MFASLWRKGSGATVKQVRQAEVSLHATLLRNGKIPLKINML
jgi:hypothetical protein